MERVRQCPYKTSFLCYFLEFAPLFNYCITFLIYNTKISDNNAEFGKVPRMLAAFPRWMAREILSKRNFLDFESPDSAISRSPMTLMKSIVSLF
jgi:hypothetical protein